MTIVKGRLHVGDNITHSILFLFPLVVYIFNHIIIHLAIHAIHTYTDAPCTHASIPNIIVKHVTAYSIYCCIRYIPSAFAHSPTYSDYLSTESVSTNLLSSCCFGLNDNGCLIFIHSLGKITKHLLFFFSQIFVVHHTVIIETNR